MVHNEITLKNGFSHASTPRTISKGNFYFPKYIISVSQGSAGIFNWEIRADWESNAVHNL